MEPPVDFSAESVRNEKVKMLPGDASAARSRTSCEASTGPATSRARDVPAIGRSPASSPIGHRDVRRRELLIDNWRWAGTPFYVRVGKRLPKRETTIAIQFQRAPHPPFAKETARGHATELLVVHVQPDEGVSLAIGAKVPARE